MSYLPPDSVSPQLSWDLSCETSVPKSLNCQDCATQVLLVRRLVVMFVLHWRKQTNNSKCEQNYYIYVQLISENWFLDILILGTIIAGNTVLGNRVLGNLGIWEIWGYIWETKYCGYPVQQFAIVFTISKLRDSISWDMRWQDLVESRRPVDQCTLIHGVCHASEPAPICTMASSDSLLMCFRCGRSLRTWWFPAFWCVLFFMVIVLVRDQYSITPPSNTTRYWKKYSENSFNRFHFHLFSKETRGL